MSRHTKNCEICGRRIGTGEDTAPMEILDNEGYRVNVDACSECQTKNGDNIFDFDEIVCSECGGEAPIINGVYDEAGWTQQEYGWLCPVDAKEAFVPPPEASIDDTERLTRAIDNLVKELPPQEQYRIAIIRASEEYLNLLGIEEGVDDYSKTIAELAVETLTEWVGGNK